METRRLPPLNALRAFEAAARHLSVKNAADELCVTPGAVSQMLKVLERHLGVSLFRRVNRGIFLTDAGQAYLPAIRSAFRQIGEATGRVAAATGGGTLTVSVPPFFASAWLVPRLKDFSDAHPEIDLQVMASKALTDFKRDSAEIAIRHGFGVYPGLHAERLFAVELVPVASPVLVGRLGRPGSAAMLMQWPLVHDAERKNWDLWFQAGGLTDVGSLRGPGFDDLGLLLRAVLGGQGAGLLPAVMVAPDLAAGRLVRLADVVWPEGLAYYLVYPEASHDQPKVAAFRGWLVTAAGSIACANEFAGSGTKRNDSG